MIGNIYLADKLKNWNCQAGLPDGRNVLARPIHHEHMVWSERLIVAWGVFTGKYDALRWAGQ